MLERYVKSILASRVYDVASETPLQLAAGLSAKLGSEIWLKREDLQPIFSFKIRGAYNKIAGLDADARKRGIIAASAGNHAQGVALAGRKLGIRTVIVMGKNTPDIKVEAVRSLGAKVVLHGDTFDDAKTHADALVNKHGYVFVHPYDDAEVIAGQGTVAVEIINQFSASPGGVPDAIFVPVGGGGLIAGIAAFVKYIHPGVQVIGVEAEGSACLAAAMKAGRRVTLPAETLDLFADGVSVAQIGKETFRIAKRYVDDVITVNTDEICAAVKDTFDNLRAIVEPSGALALAGVKKYVERTGTKSERLVAIASGANMNFDRLRHISERADIGEQREVILGVTIDEKPGSFRRFCHALGKRSVTEFNYRFAGGTQAQIYVGVAIRAAKDRDQIIAGLQRKGYAVEDMTDNETAKLHVRHMVGGHSVDEREVRYRFEFPERPGALMKFLSGLGQDWNISLFHYRNHGAAFGRVLVGFSGMQSEQRSLDAFLREIGYRYWEESDNPAIEMFLG